MEKNETRRSKQEKEEQASILSQMSSEIRERYIAQKESFEKIKEKRNKINNHANASDAQKAMASMVAVGEGAIAAFTAAMGTTSQLSEAVMIPILKRLNASKGEAILPVCRQLDPVIGIDCHMVVYPPVPTPVPLPHPYIGISFRAKDFLSTSILNFAADIKPTPAEEITEESTNEQIETSIVQRVDSLAFQVGVMAVGMLGASVVVEGVPRTVAGTSSKNIVHFPLAPAFHPVFSRLVEKDHGHALLGSLFVVADGFPLTGEQAHLHNSCWDVGIVSIHNLKPNRNTDGSKKKFRARLYVPSGAIVPFPRRTTILTNKVPSPINPLEGPKMLFKGGFTKLKQKRAKKVQENRANNKACNNVSRALNGINSKLFNNKATRGLYNKVNKLIKTYVGHPVDVAGGDLFTDSTDFSFSGVIPFSFDRVWYSDSDYQGPLGYGWHHSFDMALFINEEHRRAQVRLEDGRLINFDRIPTKALPTPRYHRSEKLWLCYHEDGYYYLRNQQELMYLFLTKKYTDRHDGYLLSAISNKDGFAIRFSYDHKGTLQEIKDSVSRVYTFDSDKEGRITKVWTDAPEEGSPKTCISEYVYNTHGDMSVHYDEMRQPIQMVYEHHLLVKETWRNGHNWHFKYDGNKTGAKCIETWGDGGIQHFKLAYYKGETHALDGEGHKTIYKHLNGVVYETTDANGAVWKKFYNKYSELERSTDPLGNERFFLRDDYGNVSKVILPDGQFTQVSYTETQYPYLPTEVIDARGGKWLYKYNDAGRIREMVNPLGAKTSFTYNKEGLSESIISGLGVRMQMRYDRNYNLSERISTTGKSTQYKYDQWNRCTQVINANGVLQKQMLDKLGRPIVIHDFDGNTIHLRYDAIGNITYYEDCHRNIRYTYRGIHKLSSRHEAGKVTRYGYDSNERLRSITNEEGRMYFFGLDAVGNLVHEKSFDGMEKSYSRNKAGWVTRVLRPDDRWTEYTHDQMGRVTEVNYSDESTERYDYEAGLLTAAVNNAGTLEIQYDILGNVIAESFNGEEVQSTYDAYGRRTKLSSSLGANFEHSFDQWSNVIESQLNSWQTTMAYDPFGMETIREYAGGIKQEWEYDKIGRLKNQRVNKQHSTIYAIPDFNRVYTWDQGGLLRQITDQGHKHTYFEHDKRGFLQGVIYDGIQREERGVDSSGNLYSQLDCTDRKYVANRLEETKTAKYKYDKEGNLIQKTEKATGKKWQYSWNGAAMLTEVRRPDGYTVRFKYDALGRRVSKRYRSVTTHYVWDANVVLHEHKTFDARETTADDIITWVFEQDSFAPMAKIRGEKKYSIVTDHLGTPIRAYTEGGERIWERELDSFGNIRMNVGDAHFCNYLYQGQMLDRETGLAYNRFRYYDPEQGNYISQDPIGLAGGNPTLYAYVGDPSGWLDVFGLAINAYFDTNANRWRNPKTGEFTKDPWSRKPKSIQDKMTLEAAKNGAGEILIKKLNDPNYIGLEKWEYKVKSNEGADSVVHYVVNPATEERVDFKFKKHSNE